MKISRHTENGRIDKNNLHLEKIGSKIRDGRLDLVPYLAVVGAKASENNSVALRSRKEGELGEVSVDTVVEKLLEEVKKRVLRYAKHRVATVR